MNLYSKFKLYQIAYYLLVSVFLLFLFSCGEKKDSKESLKGKELHHVFPRQYEKEFQKAGMDIHKYTIPLDKETHRLLHCKSPNNPPNCKDYNQSIGEYIKRKKEKGEQITKRGAMKKISYELKKRGVEGEHTFYDYRTRKPTGETLKVPKDSLWKNIGKVIGNFLKALFKLKK